MSAAAQTGPERVWGGCSADPGCPHGVSHPRAGCSAQAGAWFYRVCCVTCRDPRGVRGALDGRQVPEGERGVSGEGWGGPARMLTQPWAGVWDGAGSGVPDAPWRGWYALGLILHPLAWPDGAALRVSLGRCWALNENMAYWWIIRIPILLASLVGGHPPAPHLFGEQQLSPCLPAPRGGRGPQGSSQPCPGGRGWPPRHHAKCTWGFGFAPVC